MFRVASGKYTINYDYKCRSWYANEMRRISWVRYYWRMTRVCPCDFRLAWMDGRWRFDYGQYYRTRRLCFYERMPWGISTQVTIIVIIYVIPPFLMRGQFQSDKDRLWEINH